MSAKPQHKHPSRASTRLVQHCKLRNAARGNCGTGGAASARLQARRRPCRRWARPPPAPCAARPRGARRSTRAACMPGRLCRPARPHTPLMHDDIRVISQPSHCTSSAPRRMHLHLSTCIHVYGRLTDKAGPSAPHRALEAACSRRRASAPPASSGSRGDLCRLLSGRAPACGSAPGAASTRTRRAQTRTRRRAGRCRSARQRRRLGARCLPAQGRARAGAAACETRTLRKSGHAVPEYLYRRGSRRLAFSLGCANGHCVQSAARSTRQRGPGGASARCTALRVQVAGGRARAHRAACSWGSA